MTTPPTCTTTLDLCLSPDRQRFALSAEQWADFMTALDAPPKPHPRLQRLLQEPSIFDVQGLRI